MVLDITLDTETLSLSPTAAITQIAAIVWQRNAFESPFTDDRFVVGIDVRSCVAIGCDIDPKTVKFWADQQPEVRQSVLLFQPSMFIGDALSALFDWIEQMKKKYGADDIRLWMQGTDFDAPILRYAAMQCGLAEQYENTIPRTALRDARGFILELGKHAFPPYFPLSKTITVRPKQIYDNLLKMPDDENKWHDALYDCRRTTWNVWNIIRQHHEKYPIPD